MRRSPSKSRREKTDAELAKMYEGAPRFSSYGEVEMALVQDLVKFHTPVFYWMAKSVDSERWRG